MRDSHFHQSWLCFPNLQGIETLVFSSSNSHYSTRLGFNESVKLGGWSVHPVLGISWPFKSRHHGLKNFFSGIVDLEKHGCISNIISSSRYRNNYIYYKNMSVLPKNRQLVFPLRNYIRDTSDIFSIFSLKKILLTSFLYFSRALTSARVVIDSDDSQKAL